MAKKEEISTFWQIKPANILRIRIIIVSLYQY